MLAGEVLCDLHCHYPMHVVGADPDDGDPTLGAMLAPRDLSLGQRIRAWVLRRFAERINDPTDRPGDWRVDLDGLRDGEVRVVCSVLYDPFSEMDLGRWFPGAPPEDAYFASLVAQLEQVEADLGRHEHATVVRTAPALDAALADPGGVAFVHCVEGGFHLGRSLDRIDDRVAELSRRGVLYVTLAHLFWRRVASNAPALPFLPDWLYRRLFGAPGKAGLTEVGEAAVRAMHRHGVLVDLSHMRDDALAETLALLDRLDQEAGRAPEDTPVLASHAGYRFGDQAYMLDDATVRAVARRDGVIGLILARHQLEDGLDGGDGLDHTVGIVRRHVDRIAELTGSHRHVGIGSDLDGFIKPTMPGIEHARDLGPFAERLRGAYGETAEDLLGGNALRVVRAALAARGA